LKGSVVLAVLAIIYKIAARTPGIIQEPLQSYDFIIGKYQPKFICLPFSDPLHITHETFRFLVGGGSAGCVLAARLSDRFSVLVVEAGEQFGWVAKIPLGAPFLQKTENDWQYETEPQQHSSYGLVDQVPYTH